MKNIKCYPRIRMYQRMPQRISRSFKILHLAIRWLIDFSQWAKTRYRFALRTWQTSLTLIMLKRVIIFNSLILSSLLRTSTWMRMLAPSQVITRSKKCTCKACTRWRNQGTRCGLQKIIIRRSWPCWLKTTMDKKVWRSSLSVSALFTYPSTI